MKFIGKNGNRDESEVCMEEFFGETCFISDDDKMCD